MKKSSFRILNVLAFVGVSVALVGCGSSSAPDVSGQINGIYNGGTTNGGVTPTTLAYDCSAANQKPQYGSDLYSACYNMGGQVVTLTGGQSVCKRTITTSGSLNQVFLLATGDVAGSYALNTGVGVCAKDTVNVTSSGRYGGVTVSNSSFLGIPFTSYSLDCNAFSFDGWNFDKHQTAMNNGVAAGLMASDGVATNLVGLGGTFTAQGNGYLRLGINVPYGSISCMSGTATVKVTRCVDLSGNLYPCP